MIRFLLLTTLLFINTPSATAVTIAQESFTDFEALGLRPGGGDGMLDSAKWRITGASSGDSEFGDRTASGDLARGLSTGRVRAGGLYAFALPEGKRGLGFQATGGDFTPGTLIWSVANPTDQWLSKMVFTFELWWLNDGMRSTEIETHYSFDGLTWLFIASTQIPLGTDALGWQVQKQDVPIGWNAHGTAISGPDATSQTQAVAPGSEFWLRWLFDDGFGSGSRDEFALTSLQVRAQPLAQALPAPVALNEAPTLWCVSLFIMLLSMQRLLPRSRRTSPSCNATDT